MRRWLCALLMVVLLLQALPVSALATVGRVITPGELSAAYALTGLSDVDGAQGNAAYHRGMQPNATWNAAQLSDWLEDIMATDLHNVEDILSRIEVAMTRLQQSNPQAYDSLSGGDGKYDGVYGNLQQMYSDAEALREEMYYYRDALDERANLIAGMGSLLEQDGSGMFASERVRLSAKIETAAGQLEDLRAEVAQKAEGWTAAIKNWTNRLLLLSEGAGESSPTWLEVLHSYDGGVMENTARVTAVSALNTRMGRLSPNRSVLSANDAEATVFAMTENEIGIVLKTKKGDKMVPVPGVQVTLHDLNNSATVAIERTDENGRVLLVSSRFIADDNKIVHVQLDVDGEEKGYRSFGVEECRIKLGQSFNGVLVPLDDEPYIYSASFHSYDIMWSDFEMLYSHLNDYDFEIKVQTRNPGGEGQTPAPRFGYWKKADIPGWNYTKFLAEATSHEGNTYVFKGPWKQNITPWVDKSQKPYFTFDSADSEDARMTTRLKGVKSAVEQPVEKGSLVFTRVMGEGLSFKWTIPGANLDFKLDLPISAYLPKVTINPAGYVTLSVGSPVMQDALKKSTLNWQNLEMETYKDYAKQAEKKGLINNYLSKFGAAFDYYANRKFSILMESKIEVGVFFLASGRWVLDNQVEDVKSKYITFRGGFGMILSYSFSWTAHWTVIGYPMYLMLSLGIVAGFQVNTELGFSWINGNFQNWSFRPFRDVTITLGITFTAILGFGIKGFLESWLRFVAGINFRLFLPIFSEERSTLSGSYFLNATLGVTFFLFTLSTTFWEYSGDLFDPIPLGNAVSPLQQYALSNAQAEEEKAATQEPESYPGLVPTATQVQTIGDDPRARTRIAVIGGQTYLFYLARVAGKDKNRRMRLCWVNVADKSKSGSTQTAIDAWNADLNARNDYAFDVTVADGYVFASVACAAQFDENGNPKPNTDLNDGKACNQIFYLTLMQPDGKGNLTGTLTKGYYITGYSQPSESNPDPKNTLTDHVLLAAEPAGTASRGVSYKYYYDSIDSPEITWAKAFTRQGSDVCQGIEFFGTFGRVQYSEEEAPGGVTSYEMIAGVDGVRCFTDQYVQSGMGKDYVRTEVHGAMRCSNTQPKVHDRNVDQRYSPSFLALSQPKDGGEGDSAIELFDFEMNGVYADRKSIVLKQGAIEHFEMAQVAADDGGTDVRRMVFYTEQETSDDGAVQSRLYGLYIEPLQRDGRDMTFDVTEYTYDLTMPAGGRFQLAYIGDVPYLYWMTTAPREKATDKDVYRIVTSAYDISTNTMTAPAVYAEFTLPQYKYTKTVGKKKYSANLDLVPQNVILTGTGTAYLSAVAGDNSPLEQAIEKSKWPQAVIPDTPPVAIYSFPVQMKPILTLQNLFFEDTTVCVGDFESVTFVAMNEGNMGISSFDLELYTLSGGKAKVEQTLHADCLHPEKSTLTLAGSQQTEEIPDGTPVIYRNSDYDYTPRQRDWVLEQKKQQYHVTVNYGVKLESVEEIDSQTQFIQTDIMMPGALASFTATVKIPGNWSGDTTLYMRVSKMSTYSNWVRAMANAAGAKASGLAANAAAPEELTWELDESTGRMVLNSEKLASNGIAANAIRSGIIANAVEATDDIALTVTDQDIEIDHRVYDDGTGQDLVDIIVTNYAATLDSFKLTCAVYLDQEEEPYYVSLPYYSGEMADRYTHTITLPVSTLVPDMDDHYQAHVIISAVDRNESALLNNEFTIYLGAGELSIARQPQDQTVQEGGDATFQVAVRGGAQPYSYQWQIWDAKHKKWVDLAGFTEATLSRKGVEKKWDGCKFRCIITDAAGRQVVSREVTLTVRDKVPTGDNSHLPLYLAVALAALVLLWLIRRRAGYKSF